MMDIVTIGRRVKAAESEREKAIFEAKAVGVPVSTIAKWSGLSRQTVYNILEEES